MVAAVAATQKLVIRVTCFGPCAYKTGRSGYNTEGLLRDVGQKRWCDGALARQKYQMDNNVCYMLRALEDHLSGSAVLVNVSVGDKPGVPEETTPTAVGTGLHLMATMQGWNPFFVFEGWRHFQTPIPLIKTKTERRLRRAITSFAHFFSVHYWL